MKPIMILKQSDYSFQCFVFIDKIMFVNNQIVLVNFLNQPTNDLFHHDLLNEMIKSE